MKNQIPLFQQGEHLKQIKTKNMPLAPKQQPPYYVAEPMPTPPTGGSAIRLYANTTHVDTVSTTETTFYTFNIPANTLTTNGDSVKIKLIAISAAAGSFNTKIKLNGTLLNTLSTILQGAQEFNAEIIKTGTTTADIYYNKAVDTNTEIQVQQLTSQDFTTTNQIIFTGQSGDATILTAWGVTMDKYTI